MLDSRAIPEPLFGCAVEACREEQTWPAEDMLYWNGKTFSADSVNGPNGFLRTMPAGWYCPNCLAYFGAKPEYLGLRVVRLPLGSAAGRVTIETCHRTEADDVDHAAPARSG